MRGKASSVHLISCRVMTSGAASASQSSSAGRRARIPLMLKVAIFMGCALGVLVQNGKEGVGETFGLLFSHAGDTLQRCPVAGAGLGNLCKRRRGAGEIAVSAVLSPREFRLGGAEAIHQRALGLAGKARAGGVDALGRAGAQDLQKGITKFGQLLCADAMAGGKRVE